MHRSVLLLIFSSSLAAAPAPLAGPQVGSVPAEDRCYEAAAGRAPHLVLRNGLGVLDVRMRGEALDVRWNGAPVPEARVGRDGDVVTVSDPAGTPAYRFAVTRVKGGRWRQLAWSPHLDPSTSASRLGLTLSPLDETLSDPDLARANAATPGVAQRVESNPDRVLVVEHVVEGGSAWDAGVRPDDLVVQLAGIDLTSPVDLHRAVSGADPGDVVNLTLHRAGSPVDVAVTVGAARGWPSVAETGQVLRSALHGEADGGRGPRAGRDRGR